MFKKYFVFLFMVIFFFGFKVASADLVINEVLYSPSSKQWVEIYNSGDTSVDLTTYKILDSGASVNGHGISVVAGSSTSIAPHSYAVVAKAPDDFGSVSYPLLKSSLGIKTTGDTVTLRDTSGTVPDNIVTTDSSATSGNSLQLISGSWVSSVPTPGAENVLSSSQDDQDNTGDDDSNTTSNTNNTSSSSSHSSSSSTAQSKKSTAQITLTVPKVAFTGIPFDLTGIVIDNEGTKLNSGRYFWNFGDGNSKETQEVKSFEYTYSYPGEYVISLEYYMHQYSDTPDFTKSATIVIAPMDVSISKIGDEKDFFIELSNNTSYQMDVSGWVLSSEDRTFVLPRDSVILPKKKIILSPKTTGFSVSDEKTLKLSDDAHNLIYDYGSSHGGSAATTPQAQPSAPIKPKPQPVVSKKPVIPVAVAPTDARPPELPLEPEDLSASALSSQTSEPIAPDDGPFLFPAIAIVLIAGSAGAVYFIRRKKITTKSPEDFEILDE